ncbi:MAG: M23 family metallopeptidase [Caldilineaceae bacterium]|nr:M23 family metallopeptidase [Caldilineaceae bacterium]
MLTNPPLIGSASVIQGFGADPERYGGIACGGVPLRGHNGMDFNAAPNSPVMAVQDGVVLAVGDEPDGFGHYVLLGHYWGQSLYAHLDRATVAPQQNVQGGDQIGFSGSSGAGSTPHFHFGMRITPFAVNDGWCGYVDPEPYLRRLLVPRGAIIGPHIVGGVVRHLDLLRRWQPRMVLVLDPNPDEVRQLREACPATAIIGRIFEPDNVIDERIRANPKEAAAWAHAKIMSRLAPEVDYWQFANEVLQKADTLPLLGAFEQERMRLADANGYKCAIFGFSVGNPDLPEHDRMADWRRVYPVIEYAEQHDHCISVHQYGMPDIWGPDNNFDWYLYRLEHQVLRRLPFKRVKFAVTEYGIDGLIQGDRGGWQTYTSADNYVNQLLKGGAYAERFSGRVLGYAVFTFGHNPPWGSYDIAGAVADQLAARSPRGTWEEVDTNVNDFAHDSDITEPGSSEPANPVTPTEPTPAEPEPQPTEPEPTQPAAPPIERRTTEWFDHYNMQIATLAQRPDNPDAGGDTVYVLRDVFTTYLGSWEPSNETGSIPQWARDAYLSGQFLEAGADHHLFGAVLDRDGNLIKDTPLRFWSDGFDKLADGSYEGYLTIRTKSDSGWANNPMGPGSSYVPERGERGPWCWAPEGAAEVMCGGGLPARHHLSTFAVWQAMDRTAYEAAVNGGTPVAPPVEPPVAPPTEPVQPPTEPTEPAIEIDQRITPWFNHMNMSIQSIADRPDNPDPNGDKVYLVKDVFTTINGSWEPSDTPYSIPQWARDAYLKPWGAPDYFDDAGADHHLFVAVLGEDGELRRFYPVRFWSDGFAKLGDPSYEGYVHRETKERSGWINIPIGPDSNFVPERDESGPWCWAPDGAAEVICGGGLPAKQHVSTFVVWQEAPRSAIDSGGEIGGPISEPGEGEIGDPISEPGEGDHTIFMPTVFGPGGRPASAPAPQADAPFPAATGSAAGQDLGEIRWSAWVRLGYEGGQNSALAIHARRNGLGMPVTPVYRHGDLILQGYLGGIVFHKQGKPETVQYTEW